jgi:hypothetical protein
MRRGSTAEAPRGQQEIPELTTTVFYVHIRGMNEAGYSISDIAAAICRAADIQDVTPLLRAIRYWASEGILRPLGPLHTGRGRDRLFCRQEILRTAILHEMSKWNLTVGTMKILMAEIDKEAISQCGGSLLDLVALPDADYFRFSTHGYPKSYMLLTRHRPAPPANRSQLYISARRLRTDLRI